MQPHSQGATTRHLLGEQRRGERAAQASTGEREGRRSRLPSPQHSLHLSSTFLESTLSLLAKFLLHPARSNRGTTAIVPAARILLVPKDQSQAAGGTHPPHCSLCLSLKILILSSGRSKAGQHPGTARQQSGLAQRSLLSAVPGLSPSHRSTACTYSWGHEAWKERAAMKLGETP